MKDCPFRYQGQYDDVEIGLYYNRFRYYSPVIGWYISKDPIGLRGGIQLYGYVHDTNRFIDPFGLSTFEPKVLTEGTVFRGNKPVAPSYSPTSRDISHFEKTGKMPGISTFDSVESVSKINNKFNLGMEDAFKINTANLGNDLSAVLDTKDGHVSIMPSEDYLKKNNMTMLEALEDWKSSGDSHALSKKVSNAVVGVKCL